MDECVVCGADADTDTYYIPDDGGDEGYLCSFCEDALFNDDMEEV